VGVVADMERKRFDLIRLNGISETAGKPIQFTGSPDPIPELDDPPVYMVPTATAHNFMCEYHRRNLVADLLRCT
jgi:hypothetical protein